MNTIKPLNPFSVFSVFTLQALLAINQYRKTLNSRVKDLRVDLKVFENNKEIADKLIAELNETKVRMATYQQRGKQYLSNIKELRDAIQPLREVQHKLGSFDSKREILKTKMESTKAQVLSLDFLLIERT